VLWDVKLLGAGDPGRRQVPSRPNGHLRLRGSPLPPPDVLLPVLQGRPVRAHLLVPGAGPDRGVLRQTREGESPLPIFKLEREELVGEVDGVRSRRQTDGRRGPVARLDVGGGGGQADDGGGLDEGRRIIIDPTR